MFNSLQNCAGTGLVSALRLAPNATPIVISQICFLWGTTFVLYCLAKKVITQKPAVLESAAEMGQRRSYHLVREDSQIDSSVRKGLLMSTAATLALTLLFLCEGVRKGCRAS